MLAATRRTGAWVLSTDDFNGLDVRRSEVFGPSDVVKVECKSRPGTPCDTTPHSSNYGKGWAGTNGVPTLTASAPPKLGTVTGLTVGNSYGQPTTGYVLFSIDALNQVIPAFGGTLLVAQPIVIVPIALPPGGQNFPLPIPNDPLFLSGLGIAVQALVDDPGAKTGKLAFSRGLVLVLGL